MRVKARLGYILASALATQLMLGCQPGEKEDNGPTAPTVSVPTDLEHPQALVGNWQEAKGKQTVQLNADGTGEIISKITIGADVTRGASQGFDKKLAMKWGVKEESFYFTEMKNSPPLSYDLKIVEGKFLLSNNGSKLTYSRLGEKQTK